MAENAKVEADCKVISFINMKGGVGKTSLSINVADSLAAKGFKTLVIDTDPQFNSTQSLLLAKTIMDSSDKTSLDEKQDSSAAVFEELSNNKQTLYQIFEPTNLFDDSSNLVINIKQNLDLIPGDLQLASAISGDTSGKEEVLYNHIEKFNLKSDYKYIIIDCPPTWSILTHSSLYASDFYIVPSKIDFYSSLGIELLTNQITTKLLNSRVYKSGVNELTPLGIIFTMTHNPEPTYEKKRRERIEQSLDDTPIFTSKLVNIASAQTNFALYSEVKGQSKYEQLTNSIDRITDEIIDRITDEITDKMTQQP